MTQKHPSSATSSEKWTFEMENTFHSHNHCTNGKCYERSHRLDLCTLQKFVQPNGWRYGSLKFWTLVSGVRGSVSRCRNSLFLLSAIAAKLKLCLGFYSIKYYDTMDMMFINRSSAYLALENVVRDVSRTFSVNWYLVVLFILYPSK